MVLKIEEGVIIGIFCVVRGIRNFLNWNVYVFF